ncbi:hypothetical protein [Nostoc sp. CMAA1605]|uniref:hypothetical protein n=1 Tax=Nostoc sp. CMAA1605 TaxID=2055159 RepID=UPI001F3884B7|nr:hypothetical protein [Nostoc sp. CMAA1605]MCF4965921.1 hypothetical protein [Nostoc sp. CMAA1605]
MATRKIILHTLRCDKAEDYFGGDETLLEVFTDGQQRSQIKKDMKAGDTWLLGKSFNFSQDATIKLWDEYKPSWRDPNYFLGEFKVGGLDVNFGIAKFTKGADYTLTYTVTTDRQPQVPPQTSSHVTIEILDVYCSNTENPTNVDDIYILGGVTVFDTQTSTLDTKQAKPVLTKPVAISHGQTQPIPFVVFDADVKTNSAIYLEMAAYSEDFTKDWSQYLVWLGIARTAIRTIVNTVAILIAGALVNIVLVGLNQFAGWDKDERLGIQTHTIMVQDMKPGETIYDWRMMETGLGRSTGDYKVRYKITVR